MKRDFVKMFAESGIATVKSALQSANNLVQSISLNDIGKACNEAQERFVGEYKRFKNQLRTFIDKHTVEIPYDKNTQYMSYEMSNGSFQVSVNSFDCEHVSSHVITLPPDVDTSEITQSYDSERKVMVFKFGKKID